MPQADPGSGKRGPTSRLSRAREITNLSHRKLGQMEKHASRPPTPAPHRIAHRCCSPTSPRVITCGTSSCVGHSPELMHPNTPHSSRIPNSSSSMSPQKARGGTGRRGRSVKHQPAARTALTPQKLATAASFPVVSKTLATAAARSFPK